MYNNKDFLDEEYYEDFSYPDNSLKISEDKKQNTTKIKDKSIGDIEMIKIVGLNKLPIKKYIIKRFEISAGNLVLLCASGSSGKTLLVQYIACCVSSGIKVFGNFDVDKGNVIHIDQEQSLIQTQRRYERIASGMNLSELNIKRITLENRFDAKKLNPIDVEDELIEVFKGTSLVIIDSLKACSEVEENSAEIEMILKLFKRVAIRTDCAILLVHHKGKGKDAKQSGRGHSSIYDSVDVQIDLDLNDDIYELKCAKNREGKYFAGITYQLLDTGNFNLQQNCSEKLEFKLLKDNIENKMMSQKEKIIAALRDGEKKQKELYNLVKGDRNTFGEILKAMKEVNEIIVIEGFKGTLIYKLNK